MCEHLAALDNELKGKGIKETFRGQPWSDNTREWVYYDCVLAVDEIRQRYSFPDFIETHINDDGTIYPVAKFKIVFPEQLPQGTAVVLTFSDRSRDDG